MKAFHLIFLFFSICLNSFPQNIPDFNKIRKDIRNSRRSIESAYNLGMSFSPAQFDSAFYYSNYLLNKVGEGNNDSARYFGTVLRAKAFYNGHKFDSTIYYLEKVLPELSGNNTYREFYYSAKNLYGLALWRSSEIEKAKNVFVELLGEMGNFENKQIKSGVYGNLAILYKQLGDYTNAIEYYEKSVELNSDNPFAVANTFLSIGSIYNRLKKFEEANNYFNRALAVEGTEPLFLLSVYTGKANNFKMWNKIDSAEHYFRKGYDLSQSLPDHPTKVRPLIEIANINIKKGKLREAKQLAEEALRISQNLNDKLQSLISRITLAKIILNEGNYKETIKLGNEIIEAAKENKLENALRDTYKIISTAYDSLGDIENAHAYMRLHAEYIEKMKNYGRMRTEIDMRAKYNAGNLKKRIADTEKTNKINFILLTLSGIGIIIFIYLSYMGFKMYKAQKSVSLDLIEKEKLQSEKIDKLVNKLKEAEAASSRDDGFIFVNNQRIEFKNIIHISSSGHYLYYHLIDESSPIIERRNLKDILNLLPANQFVRIHRSNIVNIRHVKYFTLQDVALTNDNIVKISRTYKNKLLELMDRDN